MQSTVNLQTVGLYGEPNQLTVPEGALTDASNVIIQRDNVIEPRRGYSLYGNPFGTSTDVLKQLINYKARLFRHWGSTLDFDTGTKNNAGQELFEPFAASVVEAQAGLRTKSVESNGNLYFTSSQGIRKISAATASDFTTNAGYVTLAGGVKAFDLSATPIIAQGNITGFLPEDSTTAYRAVWGTTDLNHNLILGVPSQRAEVFNDLNSLLILDTNNTLAGIQNVANLSTSLINEPDYISSLFLPITSTPTLVQQNLISLASKLDNNILLANSGSAPLTISSVSIENNSASTPNAMSTIANNVCTINFSAGNPTNYWRPGNHIYLSGFVNGENGQSLNGAQSGLDQSTNIQTITSVTNNSITFLTSVTGNSQTFSSANINVATNEILITNNGFSNSDQVKFSNSGGSLPSGLVANTVYYLGNVTTNSIQVFQDSALSIPVQLGDFVFTVTSANATVGAVYSNNNQDYTVASTIFAGTSLTASGTGAPVTNGNYTFTVTAATATHGAVYSNNRQTFTVVSDITASTTLIMNGTGSPQTSGVLTRVSGIGDATINYSAYTNVTTGVLTKVSGTGDNTITFSTFTTSSGTGVNTIDYFMPVATASINSGEFRFITQPTAPDTPASDQELVALQSYLESIILALQALPTTYAFTVTSANATTGAIYTNNGFQFTVASTITAATSLLANGTGNPTASGALIKSSGTGDSPINFSSYSLPVISLPAQTVFIDNLSITRACNVKLVVTIPQEVIATGTSTYFLQLYRAPYVQATGTTSLSDLTAS